VQQLTGLDRELALPSPGSDRQLAEQAARLHARPLDRSRPLWEICLIFGLQGGRAAIYSKVHHAAIDGVSGNDALAALLDLSPEGRKLPDPHLTGQSGNRRRSTCSSAAPYRSPATRSTRCGSPSASSDQRPRWWPARPGRGCRW
jgi:Wax ester synthase-like Acyl-CoA acyltransferase domain